MRIAGLAFTLFSAAFLLHWIVWRIQIPRRQTAAILLILLGSLPLGLAAVIYLPSLRFIGPISFFDALQIALFHVALSLAYVVAYTAIEGRSPSMALLVSVANSGDKGRSRTELESLLSAENPVAARLQAMLLDRMVVVSSDSYCLTAKGWAWARTLGMFRKLLRMEKGG